MKNKVCICQFLGTKYFLKIKLDEDKKNYVYFMDGDFTIRIDLRDYGIDEVIKKKDVRLYNILFCQRSFKQEIRCEHEKKFLSANSHLGFVLLSDKVFTKKQKKRVELKALL